MATTRIQEKISRIVRNQLPEFIKNDYETFTTFLEYYYQYVEQDQQAQELIQNARSYADIDRTAASFVSYFLTNYGNKLPTSSVIDKALLIKRVKDLYEAKGSELSFKLLFRLLYDADISINYPYSNVLRASDGRWQQLVSIRVEIVTGTNDQLYNHVLYTEKNSVTYSTPIIKTSQLREGLIEVFIDRNSSIVRENIFEEDDEIYTLESGVEVFRGKVKLTTTQYSIQNGGKNFKAGQIFKVNLSGAVNTLIQVTNVSSVGAIQEVKFVNYGYDFTSNLTLNFSAISVVGQTSDEYVTRSNGFSESGVIFGGSGDYFAEEYVEDPTYNMTVVETFSTTQTETGGTDTGSIDDTYATILFSLGTLARYPGLFVTNNGFISDIDICLQDDQLYQPFAYQVSSELDINTFYDTIISLVHPAGQKLFNNRALISDVNVNANIGIVDTLDFSVGITDALSLLDSASLELQTTLATSATEGTTDSANLTIYTSINNAISTISLTDSNIYGISYAEDYTEPDYWRILYSADPPEGELLF